MRKQYSDIPKEKLEYLREQKHLIELSIAMLDDKINNPAPPIDHEELRKWRESIPHIGEYRDGKYHYYDGNELAEQERRLGKWSGERTCNREI